MNLIAKKVSWLDDPLYAEADALYAEAFPRYQRRGPQDQALAFGLPEYRLDAWFAEDKFAAAVCWWDFPDMRYLEFLAVSPQMRSLGIGGKVLQTWLPASDKPAVLEIDPVRQDGPADDPSKRRLVFYQRLGFKENSFRHGLPSYVDNSGYYPAELLTWPRAFTEDDFAAFTKHLQDVVFSAIGRGWD